MRPKPRPHRGSAPRSPYPDDKGHGHVLSGSPSTTSEKINAQRGLGRGKERGDEGQEDTRTTTIPNDLFKHAMPVSVLVITECHMIHRPVISVGLVKHASMSSSCQHPSHIWTADDLISCPHPECKHVRGDMHFKDHAASVHGFFFLPGHRSIEGVRTSSLATSSELISALQLSGSRFTLTKGKLLRSEFRTSAVCHPFPSRVTPLFLACRFPSRVTLLVSLVVQRRIT